MNQLLQYLERYKPEPQYAQIATQGNWEDALRIDFDTTPGLNLLSETIDASIAGEIFYKLNDGRVIFLGLRYSPLMSSVSSPAEFLQKLQTTLQHVPQKSIPEVFEALGRTLHDDPKAYTGAKASYVELGVIDYWKSMGSCVVRKYDDPPVTKEFTAELLKRNEPLAHNQSNHTALEFACASPEHWIAVQTSTLQSGQYATDIDLLTHLANMV